MNFIYTRYYYGRAGQGLTFIDNQLEDDKVLVISPHVDDETIGMGGTLLKYRNRGARISLVYITDGSGSVSDLSKLELSKARAKEAREVQESYGVGELYFLDQLDGSVNSEDQEAVLRLVEILDIEKPRKIYTPNLLDGHRDHIASTILLLKAIEIWDRDFKNICMYEVNTMNDPRLINRVTRLDESLYKEKASIYRIFKSQDVMGFDAFLLMDRSKAKLISGAYGAEVFLLVSLEEAKKIDQILLEMDFKPEKMKQLASQYNLLISFFKNRSRKQAITNEILRAIK